MRWEDFLRQSKGKARKRPCHLESEIQAACVNWFRLKYPQYVIFSVPNGGSRNLLEAVHLKSEGALAGVADLIALAPSALLFVEMKTKKGKQTQHQKVFEEKVCALGFRYCVCHSLEEFTLTIEKWIKQVTQKQFNDERTKIY